MLVRKVSPISKLIRLGLTIISLADDGLKRVRRSIGGPKPWPEYEKIYITWDQVLQGILSEHQAIGDA